MRHATAGLEMPVRGAWISGDGSKNQRTGARIDNAKGEWPVGNVGSVPVDKALLEYQHVSSRDELVAAGKVAKIFIALDDEFRSRIRTIRPPCALNRGKRNRWPWTSLAVSLRGAKNRERQCGNRDDADPAA